MATDYDALSEAKINSTYYRDKLIEHDLVYANDPVYLYGNAAEKEYKRLVNEALVTEGDDVPVGKVFGAISARNTRQALFVAVGSSTINGTGASVGKGFLPVFFGRLQAAYPLDSSISQPTGITLAQAVSTPPANNGIQYVNGAVDGSNSGNYLTTTTIGQIKALNPVVILHGIGSNDWAEDTPIATYKANIEAKLDELDSGVTDKALHILIHAHQRKDAPVDSTLHTWAEYGNTLKTIASVRSNVYYVDLSKPFADAGIGSTDPYDLLATDNIHLTNAGHSAMAEFFRYKLKLGTSAFNGSNTVVQPNVSASRTCSDGFATNGELKDRAMDLLLGGAARTWVSGEALPSGFVTAGGTVGLDTANAVLRFVGTTVPIADAQISVTFVTAVTGTTGILMDLYRVTNVGSGSPDAYRINFVEGAGDVQLQKRVGGVTTVLYTYPATQGTVGSRFTLRYYRGVVSLLKDGIVVYSKADTSVARGGYAGLARANFGVTTSGALDDFVLEILS